MSLSLLPVQDAITSKLRELPQDIYETTAPEDTKLRMDTNGVLLPYAVIVHSDMYDTIDSKGVLSTRYDVKVAYADVYCMGPTERSARQLAELVRDKMVGFVPQNAGELRIDGGVSYATVDNKTNRYMCQLSFAYPVNTVW